MINRKNYNKIIAFILTVVIICFAFGTAVFWSGRQNSFAADENTVIVLQIDNPMITINGEEQAIDESGTTPVINENRTLVPIRAIIEALGGSVAWNGELRETMLTYNGDVIRLTVNSPKAFLNDSEYTLDSSPAIINGRTMLPIRFIAESFGFETDWNAETSTVTINVDLNDNTDGGITDMTINTESSTLKEETNSSLPVVYMTTDITPEALVKIYEKLDFNAEGNVAVKMSTGEPPASNYLRPELIKDLVQLVDGTIVECNTAYGGQRAETEMHKQVARDHGFTEIADVDIMDENGSIEIPVAKGTRIQKNYVGANLANYDSLISLAHFKGHAMAGFGGAIKNMSIGIASAKGKCYIHSGGTSLTDPWNGVQEEFCEAMADATSGVVDYLEGKVVYINVMNRLSIDCDCDGNPAEPDMHDVGILASTDPVALDQACIDIVYNTDREESGTLIDRIESRNGLHTLEQAEQIGLGSRTYELISID